MRRTDRLFEILQMFRDGRLLTGRIIADRLEVSLRTVYRDIDTLVASGIPIEGARGMGYLLRAPIFLPPLTLTPAEVRSLHLGVEIVRQVGDPELADAAGRLLGKIEAVLPAGRGLLDPLRAIAVHAARAARGVAHLPALRDAVGERRVMSIDYEGLSGDTTRREIRPLQTEFWGQVWTCTAWCELRGGFRVFRVDRIARCRETGRTFAPEAGRTYSDYLARLASSPGCLDDGAGG